MEPTYAGAAGIGFVLFCGVVAWKKNRNIFLWCILGLFFNVFAFIIILLLPTLEAKDRYEKYRSKTGKGSVFAEADDVTPPQNNQCYLCGKKQNSVNKLVLTKVD